MDFFQSHKLCPAVAILPSSIFPTFNCTSKTTGWFTKGAEIDPNLPHANKVLLKVAHAFLYTLMDFFQSHQTVKAVAILPSSIFQRSIASKTTGWFTKGAEIDPNLPHANKSTPR
jgi:hypothetical protein